MVLRINKRFKKYGGFEHVQSHNSIIKGNSR